jgi:2-polyprenyl-3-methyl-5-hydroxy-6-metoxy-1,4-benzoquinol methylase
MEEKFTRIYEKGIWGKKNGKGTSGSGSHDGPDAKFYVKLLMATIQTHNIKTVCDVGCGEWEFSRNIDWNGLDYTGIDCVKSVVDFNDRYSQDNICFKQQDVYENPVEKYDLVILKDVIQHWEDHQIKTILPRLLQTNKFLLLVNGYIFGRTPERNNWTQRSLDPTYHYHPVDIKKKPLSELKFKCLDTVHRRYKQFNLLTR